MSALLRNFNYARPWRGYLRVRGADIHHPSLDRWLYLFLHRLTLMGQLEFKVIETFVHPGMSVLDIGSNIGLYTSLFSRLIGPNGKVTAVEPVSALHQSLLRTIEKNQLMNVETCAFAAGSREAFVHLALDSFNSGNNWISRKTENASTDAIPVRRIDSLNFPRLPDFVKIDVQGWEVEVLRGMTGLLASDKPPVIFCEISNSPLVEAGSSPRELGQMLLDHNYDLNLPLVKDGELEIIPLSLQSLEERAVSTLYFDILALPRKATVKS